jgi:hypothetical protein
MTNRPIRRSTQHDRNAINKREELAYIDAHWADLAGMSYADYRKSGRGFVLLDWFLDEEAESRGLQNRTVAMRMKPEAVDVLKTVGLSEEAKTSILDQVNQYDPERQVVVVFRRPDGYWSVYLMEYPDRLPPAMFQLVEKSLPDRMKQSWRVMDELMGKDDLPSE